MIKGYLVVLSDSAVFMKTGTTRRTPATVKAMLKAICKMRNFSEETTERILNDRECYERIQYQMESATLEIREHHGETYFYVETASHRGGYTWESLHLAKAA